MSNWPEDGKPARFSDLARAVREAIDAAYRTEHVDDRDIPWTGPPLGEPEQATCLPFNEALTGTSLARAKEQGRDALDVIITIALQLGIEQGRRHFKSSLEYKIMRRLAIAHGFEP